ncbi:MAG: glucose-6-phosphate isomerase [Deltaproteobacteria bacterium]|nr:glucose-6-phosphate isomerase [Deltaproteobacteria bacterium]
MANQQLTNLPEWNSLCEHAETMKSEDMHLKHLIVEKERLQNFSLKGGGIFFDFSRQRVNEKTMALLFQLAETLGVTSRFRDMTLGAEVNVTEKRAALHTAARRFSNSPLLLDGKDIMNDINSVRDQIRIFSRKIHHGEIKGSTGKPFKHVVVIGIGGSYLGTEFVANALAPMADKGITLHFLSNVDIDNFGSIISSIDPETTLWIVISKSYTTPETCANENQAVEYMKANGLDPSHHLVTVTSKGSPGDDPTKPVLATFHMFDYIGGRYSVTSAVGGVPLSIFLGYDRFERFLKGAYEMDQHAVEAPLRENLPLTAALISIWNNNFLGYSNQAIIPYASALSKLAPHIQQLSMESNGKSVTKDGEFLEITTGVIVFGEPGTNAQHSFFQLAHQGRPFPIDFIGVLRPTYGEYLAKTKGVTNHQELWANLISQPMALAMGKEDEDAARFFPGNRPSSTILLEDLSPENIGRLLAFYEAKTVFEAFIWDINPFDQFGVELGKVLAAGIRKEMASKNADEKYEFDGVDPISRFYLDTLFSGKL